MNLFDKFSSDYDKMVNWKSRLAREGEFYKKIFADNGVQSILDLGCGVKRFCFYALRISKRIRCFLILLR